MKTRCCYPKRYLLLFFSLLVSVGSILMSVSLSSCSSSVKSPLLLSADSLMEIYPDSALSILESISSPQKLPRADRALYALLLTQARHKNYIALGDDSLIKMAVEYYGDKKKSVRAAKAHYYWGATYLEKGYTSFAVDEYLTAIRLMPVRDEFLAMIYDNLADCYEKDDLYDIAIEAYRQAYQILEGGSQQTYPLRGIARICLLQNKKDSALLYYQKALDYALAEQDSSLIGALYHDLAMVYNEKKDYVQADKYVSKAMIMQGDDAVNVCLSKAQIMLNLNKLDSASYFFSKNIDQLNIYGKAVCYDGMHQIAKKRGEWKIATENMDAYRVLYDSMQIMNDNEELNRLMDKHQLEEHKKVYQASVQETNGPKISENYDFKAKKDALMMEFQERLKYEQLLQSQNYLKKQIELHEYYQKLIKFLAMDGIAIEKITEYYLNLFNQTIAARIQLLNIGLNIQFVLDDGISYRVYKQGTNECLEYEQLSTGEKKIIAFLILDLLNILSGARLMFLDDLNDLDVQTFEHFIQMITNPEFQKYYDHIFIGTVLNSDFRNVLSNYQNCIDFIY